MKNDPDDFEIRENDSQVVKLFKENKVHMWFREPIDDPRAMYNNLKD